MKIKAKWGFIGDAAKLNSDSRQIKRGQVLEDVDDEYAHILIGQGLAVAVDGPAPRETKPAAPTVVKSAEDEKAGLIAKLDKAGIEYDKRWGVAKLREALDGAGSK